MLSIRKSWCAAVVVVTALAGGCSNEPAATTPVDTPAPATTPATTATPVKPDDKGGMERGMGAGPITLTPDEAAKPADAPGIQIEAPKVAPPTKDDKPAADAPAAKSDEAPKSADASKLSDDEIAEIKKLPADEQPVALKQMVCPVSDEHLGEMGVPVKVTAEGKTFYLCCNSCKKELAKNPKEYVSKLTSK